MGRNRQPYIGSILALIKWNHAERLIHTSTERKYRGPGRCIVTDLDRKSFGHSAQVRANPGAEGHAFYLDVPFTKEDCNRLGENGLLGKRPQMIIPLAAPLERIGCRRNPCEFTSGDCD
ncbi:hypothetical protein D3C72_1217200 [compost metagenome]